MPAFQCCCQTLVVPSQTPKSAEPSKGSFDDPASRQQQETSLRLVVLDDHELNPVLACSRVRLLARIALIDKGDLDFVAGNLLHACGQLLHLAAFAAR